MAAYTGTPRTWSVGETLTATLLNAEIRDVAAALSGAWTAWTPVLSGVTTSATSGKYMRVGKLIHFTLSATVSAAPTGEVSSTVPVNMVGAPVHGLARLILGSSYQGVWLYNTTSSIFIRYVIPSTGVWQALSSSAPTTWSSGHSITLSGTYEAA